MKAMELDGEAGRYAARMLATKSVRTESGCLEWRGQKNDDGYGRIRFGKLHSLCHRIAYQLAYGKFDPALCVLHKCDKPHCVEPDHLFLGTQAENMADMKKKRRGRSSRVPGDALALRTRKIPVECIRSIRMDPRKQDEIAKQYGVSQSAIGNILSGRTYRDV